MTSNTDDEIRGDLSYLFNKASQSLAARLTAALADLDVTPRDYCVLSKAEPGELTQKELADHALLDKTTMVVTVDRLESAGLARRIPAPADRRARIVQATEAGSRAAARARAVIGEVCGDVLGVLSDAEREAFLDAMVKLVGPGGPLSEETSAGAPRRRGERLSPHK